MLASAALKYASGLPEATAFAGRDARYIMNVHGRWSDPHDDARVREVYLGEAQHG